MSLTLSAPAPAPILKIGRNRIVKNRKIRKDRIVKPQFLFLQEEKNFDDVHIYYRHLIILFVAPYKREFRAGNIASQVMKHFLSKSFSNQNEFENCFYGIVKKIYCKNRWPVHNFDSIIAHINEFSKDARRVIECKSIHLESIHLTSMELMYFFAFLVSLKEYQLGVCFLSLFINGSRQNVYNAINN